MPFVGHTTIKTITKITLIFSTDEGKKPSWTYLIHWRQTSTYFFLNCQRARRWEKLLHCTARNKRELELKRFWETDVNRKWTFCIIGQWFGLNSRVNRLYKRKELSNTNLLATRHIKKEKDSLPVDVRCSKPSLLKVAEHSFAGGQRALAWRRVF